MKIKMKYTKTASPDGIHIESYIKDEVYEVGETITERTADVFVKNGQAVKFVEPPKPIKEKQVDKTEKEVKAFKKPSRNKGA